MTSLEIWNIIDEMKTIPSIYAITGDRIYFGVPYEQQTGIYIVINIIAQESTDYSKKSRVEFRFLANDETVTKKQLIELQETVTNELVYNECLGKKDYLTFKTIKVSEGRQFIILIDDKEREFLLKDYFFNFIY